MNQLWALNKTQLILTSIPLHEAHESIPLPFIAHHISSLYLWWFPIEKFGTYINRWQCTLVINHVEASNISKLSWGIKYRWLVKHKICHTIRPILGASQLHVRNNFFINTSNELNHWFHHHHYWSVGSQCWHSQLKSSR